MSVCNGNERLCSTGGFACKGLRCLCRAQLRWIWIPASAFLWCVTALFLQWYFCLKMIDFQVIHHCILNTHTFGNWGWKVIAENRAKAWQMSASSAFYLVLGSLGILRDTSCLCLLPLRDRRALSAEFCLNSVLVTCAGGCSENLSCYWTVTGAVTEHPYQNFTRPKSRAPCFSEDTASLLNVLTFCGTCDVYTLECL